VDGKSLVPILTGPAAGRSWFTIENDEPYVGKIVGIVSKEPDGHTYKYAVVGNQEHELYDLTSDPWELTNLAGDGVHGDVQARLDGRMTQALARGPGAALLNVTTIGGGTVTSTPSGISCGSDCWEIYANATQVTLEAQADPGRAFTGWGGACSGTGSCVLSMTEDRDVTATFQEPGPSPSPSPNPELSVQLAGSGSGGRVSSDPLGISCPTDCSEQYEPDTTVTLRARARKGTRFAGWGGACSGTGMCVVTVTEDTVVTATFDPA
jgi:hypothetical protein